MYNEEISNAVAMMVPIAGKRKQIISIQALGCKHTGRRRRGWNGAINKRI
jgi:hypothetical protein